MIGDRSPPLPRDRPPCSRDLDSDLTMVALGDREHESRWDLYHWDQGGGWSGRRGRSRERRARRRCSSGGTRGCVSRGVGGFRRPRTRSSRRRTRAFPDLALFDFGVEEGGKGFEDLDSEAMLTTGSGVASDDAWEADGGGGGAVAGALTDADGEESEEEKEADEDNGG